MECSKETTGIFQLANETLETIFEHTAAQNDGDCLGQTNLKVLCNISLTCKTFRSITESVLYRNLVAKHTDYRFHNFIMTLKQRPQLGKYVKSIRLLGGDLVNQDALEELTQCCKTIKEFAYMLARNHIMVSVKADWPKLVTFLSTQQQALESLMLVVRKDDQWGNAYIPWSHQTSDCFSRDPLPSLGNFTSLKNLTIDEKILYGVPTGVIRAKDTPINCNLLANLPTSIMTINIMECNPCSSNTRTQLAAFLQAIEARSFPALESVRTRFERNDCHTESWWAAVRVIGYFNSLNQARNNNHESEDGSDGVEAGNGDRTEANNGGNTQAGNNEDDGSGIAGVNAEPERAGSDEPLSRFFQSLSGISLRDRTQTIDYEPIVAEWKVIKDGFEEAGVRFIEEL